MIANRSESIPGGGRETGFTLVEMLIVMAIIAILTTIALPAYRDYVIRGKIPEATGPLATKRVQMEQVFLDYRAYDAAAAAPVVAGICSPTDTTTSRYFDFTCAGGDLGPTTYTIRAVGKADMAGFTYTIDQNGTRQTTAVPNASWGAVPMNCWITKKGGVC